MESRWVRPAPHELVLASAMAVSAAALVIAVLFAMQASNADAMPPTDGATSLIDVGPIGSRGNPIDNSLLNPIRPKTR